MPSIVVAQSSNRVIGSHGGLPWRLPTDLKRFREITIGGSVIMGRKTFESIPEAFRPLPDRRNIVLSSNPSYTATGAEVVQDLNAALELGGPESFVIGGGATYVQALALVDRVYSTDVAGEIEGDTWFPELPADEWLRTEQSDPISENGRSFRFSIYDRK